MAVPTIISLSPTDALPAGRNRVEIIGTNFRTPLEPPPGGADAPLTGPVTGDWVQTVSVTFNGLEADGVVPVSATQLWVITPEYRDTPGDLPKPVDVVVTNLDDSGVPIGGETVTSVDAFTYKRQDLTAQSDIEWVTRNVIRRLQRNIIGNVTINTWFDYASNPASGLTEISSLPVIMLLGPLIEEDEENKETENQFPVESGDDVFVQAPPFTARLLWRILVLSDGKAETLNLANLLVNDFRKRPNLTLETAPGSGELVEVELFIENWTATDDFGDGIHTMESELRLQGLLLDETYGVETGGIPLLDVVAPQSNDTDAVPQLQLQEGLT